MERVCRCFQKGDEGELALLMTELGYGVGAGDLAGRIAAIRQQGGEVLVAVCDGRVVGCVNALMDIRLAEGRAGEIASLVVSEAFRGSGLGKALVDCAETWLKQRCGLIRVRANAVRNAAHDFYRQQGYTEVKMQKIFVKNIGGSG